MSIAKLHPAALPPQEAPAPKPGQNAVQFLLPGDLWVCRVDGKLSTVIGSCVVLCLWDKQKKVGGMNHYLLPDGPVDAANRFRYANNANAALLERVIRAGANIANVSARVYGGSTAHVSPGQEETSLGYRNVCAALDFLRSTGIPLEEKQTGGKQGRKVSFEIATGKVTTELL
ncbi:MAG: chemotaxis protein CheD [Terriglobales bacterium]